MVAGGAGTRFGGAVKALVPVVDGKTFLDFKLQDVADASARAGRPIAVALMTSHLTDQAIRAALASQPSPVPVHVFQQRSLPRLRPDGSLFREADGTPSLAPAGHGDVFRALVASGVAGQLHAAGVRHLYFSNVDNLAATLDAVVLGEHLAGGAAMTVEVTARRAPTGRWMPRGAVRLRGQLQLVEKSTRRARHHLHQQHELPTRALAFAGGALALAGRPQAGGRKASHPIRASDG